MVRTPSDENSAGSQFFISLDDNHTLNVQYTIFAYLVDGDHISSRHFGVVLRWAEWEKLSMKIKNLDVKFVIEQKIMFKNKKGEQGTFFISDPCGNIIEFKTFKTDNMIFEK